MKKSSDYQKVKALFLSIGISPIEDCKDSKSGIYLEFTAHGTHITEDKLTGYHGFSAIFNFNDDGTFKRVRNI